MLNSSGLRPELSLISETAASPVFLPFCSISTLNGSLTHHPRRANPRTFLLLQTEARPCSFPYTSGGPAIRSRYRSQCARSRPRRPKSPPRSGPDRTTVREASRSDITSVTHSRKISPCTCFTTGGGIGNTPCGSDSHPDFPSKYATIVPIGKIISCRKARAQSSDSAV